MISSWLLVPKRFLAQEALGGFGNGFRQAGEGKVVFAAKCK